MTVLASQRRIGLLVLVGVRFWIGSMRDLILNLDRFSEVRCPKGKSVVS